ncbi:hypothetical protein PoB_003535800 [Plakobranchus ocellatus]|uniref:Uncharacterized protein n=1 Tax=Plakobranchus ocellatus TaxID=259542 RepID=A0AAV4APW1_9GAST|nr:hypothetical protein PoB_003535800 [Plakobranchus ocellatus]
MIGTTLVVLQLFLGIITAQKPTPTVKPTVTIVKNTSSFLCSEHFLVVGEDFVTFELRLSGNNSNYTLDIFDGPRFRLHHLVTEKGQTTVTANQLHLFCYGGIGIDQVIGDGNMYEFHSK